MSSNPLILSHRGNHKKAIENTIHACELAIAEGATALEIDIRETGCGEIVVFHDFSLRRMFKKRGYVGRLPLDILKTYPYHNINGLRSQFIETLDAFLDRFKNMLPINLDAKTIHFFDFKFADKIISIISNHGLFDTVWVSCFNPFLLQILKLKDRRIKTGYLFQRATWMHTLYDMITFTDAWHPHFRIVNARLVEKAKKFNKEIYVWTVNEFKTMERVSQFPINGLISDNVKMIHDFFNSSGRI